MFDTKHTTFLHHMLRCGYKHYDAALIAYTKLGGEKETFPNFLSEINMEIQKENFKLMKIRCEINQQNYLVMINTYEDEIMKSQHQYTGTELEYFHLILHELIHSEEKRLKLNFCLNLSAQLPSNTKFSVEAAERMVYKSCKQGYLMLDAPYVYLGPRGLSEFMPYIKGKYNGLWKNCPLCAEIVIFGSNCSSCENLFHNYCLKIYKKKNKNCPSCGVDFVQEDNSMSID